MMSEILNGIRILKLYGWEMAFIRSISHIREKELEYVRKKAIINSILEVLVPLTPILATITTFSAYILITDSNALTAEKAFVSLALFSLLRPILNSFTNVLNNTVDALVSNKRLEKFLNNEEIDSNAVDRISDDSSSLIALVGMVGSGKSSILAALLGEMNKVHGCVSINGNIAYVPQTAWIMNTTLRENILFGRDFDINLYNQIIDACALNQDLDMLPARDQTEIGEKGINLSGGQRQRVSLARALYSNADIYLLDDSLSAVDAHVGTHIFKSVIGPKGLLNGKTRLLVTHGVSHLQKCNDIMIVSEGEIVDHGSFNDLMLRSKILQDFLHSIDTSNAERSQHRGNDLAKWADQMKTEISINNTSSQHGQIYYMSIYSTLGITQGIKAFCFLFTFKNKFSGILTFAMQLTQRLASYFASRKLHCIILIGILHAPVTFFDTTPVGRIINRFAQDIESVDSMLPQAFSISLNTLIGVVTTLIILFYGTWVAIVEFMLLAIIFVSMQRVYISSSRQLRRLDSVSRSSIFTNFTETIQGLRSIRAYHAEKRFIDSSDTFLDRNQSCHLASGVANSWLGIYLELIATLFIFLITLTAALLRDRLTAGTVGLMMTCAIQLTISLNLLMQTSSKIETDIVSVERINEYAQLTPEAPWQISEKTPSPYWPMNGNIRIMNLSVRYRDNLPLVLKDLSIDVSSGEKVTYLIESKCIYG
ncbi:unnamed protein product [Rotaria sp. Silwood1]|nr:unnamed protein product [Rotaria sp. Silwood1]CAF1629153.1 unnamed protein product [Rotaria sp. Silwood1]CAF3777227.1 unnamed protein product [Rotaria sp. Silwood1]CAF3820911.1 unnamed protein product [Rotaria sp. Silwood1]CAF3842926.1 unnamed protein product [Rotaria sp. Silwood1]